MTAKVVRLMDKSVAILSRTNKGLRPFEQALSDQGVKYHLVGKSGFYSQPEIQGSLSFLGACLFPANYLISGMLRTDYHPTKFLPRTKLATRFKELKEADDAVSYWNLMTKEPRTLVEPRNLEALQHFVQFVHSLTRYRDLPADGALKSVLGALKIGDYYAEQDTIDNDPLQNLSELLKIAGRFRTIKEFLDYCRRVTAASKSRKGIALATIHAAKGLEWSEVYLVGCQDGVLPHAKSTDLAEELNCFFVACSRAERSLTVTYSGIPSIFLKKETK